jgi:formiminotetrahydrofolate cyclodeaminase
MWTMRSTWTDSRLDDLNEKVARIDGRLDTLNHTILLVGGGAIAAVVGLIAAMLGLIATQL